MRYEEVIGQEAAIDKIKKMVQFSRLPHAVLFHGAEGSGTLPAALALIAHVLCKNPTPDGSCGQCPTCNKTHKLIHPDVHFVFPIIKSKQVKTSDDLLMLFRKNLVDNFYLRDTDWLEELDAENKQSIIPVEEAAAVIKKLSYTSYEGGYKIMLIWQPEKMNNEAANSLLKILEEPPDQTLFLLVSSQPDKLLPTILSRVQQIPFGRVSDEEIAKVLVSKYALNENQARQATFLADGNFAEALWASKQQGEEQCFLPIFQQFMRFALKLDCANAINWIEENASIGREKQKQFFSYALGIFRDVLMYNYGSKDLVKTSGSEKEFLQKFAPFINEKNYPHLVEEFNSSIYHIERNANPKILFMDLFFKTHELINRK